MLNLIRNKEGPRGRTLKNLLAVWNYMFFLISHLRTVIIIWNINYVLSLIILIYVKSKARTEFFNSSKYLNFILAYFPCSTWRLTCVTVVKFTVWMNELLTEFKFSPFMQSAKTCHMEKNSFYLCDQTLERESSWNHEAVKTTILEYLKIQNTYICMCKFYLYSDSLGLYVYSDYLSACICVYG